MENEACRFWQNAKMYSCTTGTLGTQGTVARQKTQNCSISAKHIGAWVCSVSQNLRNLNIHLQAWEI